MKKYLPILIFISVFTGFISIQIISDKLDISASIPKSSRVKQEHYSSIFRETTFQTIDGKIIELTNLNSKIVIIQFWASWCIPCLREIDQLTKLYRSTSRDQVEIISINTDEVDAEKLITKIKHKYQITFPLVYDFDSSICATFDVDRLPFLTVYKNGRFVRNILGQNDKLLKELIENIK